MECTEVTAQLTDLLYDELNNPLRRRVEEHLVRCAACRSEFSALQQTARELDVWQSVEVPCDAEALTLRARAQSRPQGSVRRPIVALLRPALVGLAAACVVFFSLLFTRAEVQYGNGRLLVSFGEPMSQQTLQPVFLHERLEKTLMPMVRRVVREEIESNTMLTIEALADYLRGWELNQDRRQFAFLDALARMQQRSVRVEDSLRALAMGTAEDSMRTWETLGGVIELVREEIRPSGDQDIQY